MMTLRKHIQLSLSAILILFALNFAINFWSSQKNGASIDALHQAISYQELTAAIKQGTTAIQQQAARLGQLRLDTVTASLPPGEIEKMNLHAGTIASQIVMLQKVSDDEMRATVQSLQKNFEELAASWRVFYQNFGVNHVQALAELALHTEPLSQRLLYETIPVLELGGKQRTDAANKEFTNAQWLTTGTSSIIFILSLLAAVAIAVRIYRRVARGFDTLHQGIASINAGTNEQPVMLQTSDELGEIASTLNNQSAALRTTRNRLAELDQELEQHRQEIEKERQTSQSLLHNILPASVAEEYLRKGSVESKYLEDVTIIFTDFVNFSSFTEQLAAEDLVQILHEYFSAFDEITARYGLEKLKTIGDSYMCAGGLPERNPSHPVDAVLAAMEIVHAVTERSIMSSQHNWSIRIGIHTGHLIAGIVGKEKFAYDIWGESVNYASRLESSSEPNRITLSERTYSRIKDFFECEKRTDIPLKGEQKSDMYFLNGILPSLTGNSKQMPPPAFLRRYRSYFQKDPPSFPAFLARSSS